MAKKEIKYEEAVALLEEIVDKMENDELDIDQLSDQLKRAKEPWSSFARTNSPKRMRKSKSY